MYESNAINLPKCIAWAVSHKLLCIVYIFFQFSMFLNFLWNMDDELLRSMLLVATYLESILLFLLEISSVVREHTLYDFNLSFADLSYDFRSCLF